MKRMMFAITIAAAVSVAVCETSNAAPIATVLAPATTSADNVLPAHYYRGHYYPYRWHGHYYRYHSHRRLLWPSTLSTWTLLLLVMVTVVMGSMSDNDCSPLSSLKIAN